MLSFKMLLLHFVEHCLSFYTRNIYLKLSATAAIIGKKTQLGFTFYFSLKRDVICYDVLRSPVCIRAVCLRIKY